MMSSTDRVTAARRLLTATALMLALPCSSNVRGLELQRRAAPSNSRVLIENRSAAGKKAPGFVDRGKTVFVPPQTPAPQTPQNPAGQTPQAPPPQNPPAQTQPTLEPPLQLSVDRQQVRVGELVKFSLELRQPRDLQAVPPLVINFGDGTQENIEINPAGVSHRFALAKSYDASVSFADLRARRYQPRPLSNTVTVQVGPWSMTASPTGVEVGEPVTLKINDPPEDQNVSYRFHFREEPETTDWVPGAEATYRYHSAGTFAPLVEVLITEGSRVILTKTDPIEISVQPLRQNAILLDVAPQSVQVGNEVAFTATFNSRFEPDDDSIGFKFFYGDGSSSEWQNARTARHTYTSALDYQAQVAAGWRNPRSNLYSEIARSEPRAINVAIQRPAAPPPTDSRPGTPLVPPILIYILAGLVLIAAALFVASYQMRKSYVSVKPQYVAHADRGASQAGDGRLALDFEIRFTPNVTSARYQVDASAAGLIRFERMTHD